MGIENVEVLTEEPIDSEAAPVRESAQAERDRHDAEKVAENKARQVRLGDVPNSEESEEEKPKAKSRGRAKKTEEEE